MRHLKEIKRLSLDGARQLNEVAAVAKNTMIIKRSRRDVRKEKKRKKNEKLLSS